MITSALIAECRRLYNDTKKSTQVKRAADGAATLFNVGRIPVIENSYSVYFDTSAKTEVSDYSLDLDNGDLQTVVLQPANRVVRVDYKHANFRDKGWLDAIGYGIESLNSRGFFRQVARDTSVFRLSANVRTYSGPTNAMDVYELLFFSDYTVSGSLQRLPGNWSYQQDANKVTLGYLPTRAQPIACSYLRKLTSPSATTMALDPLDSWIPLVKLKAGAYFYRHMAAKIATEGAATIDEGHFSFTNLRTMANDLEADFERLAVRMKPTRPAKDIQWHIDGGGPA